MRFAVLLLFLFSIQTLALEEASGPAYIALSAEEKMRLIWDNISSNSTPNPWADLTLFKALLWPATPTFELPGDQLPIHREKLLHSGMGNVGKVEFVPADDSANKYTGLFKGAKHGIIRVSQGISPENAVHFGCEMQPFPGLGLKFFRDGVESASLVAMFSMYGQESWNIFANNWSNHHPPLTGILKILVGAKLASGSQYYNKVGLSDFAMIAQNGESEPVSQVNFPFKLIFKPTGEIMFPDSYHGPVHEDLASIPAGSVLWNVYALDKPEELEGKEELLGAIVLRSELVTSHWADTRLFFRHQDMGDDLKLRPEWFKHTHKWNPFSLDNIL